MVVICLANVADRFHGFLRSIMLNPHPGVYLAMDLDAGSRERVWEILDLWWTADGRGTGIMLWRDSSAPIGVSIMSFGVPKRGIVEFDGHWTLARRFRSQVDHDNIGDVNPD